MERKGQKLLIKVGEAAGMLGISRAKVGANTLDTKALGSTTF